MPNDIQSLYSKLVNKETLSEDATFSLLVELAHLRGALAFMASCQAATLEGLTKASSKSERLRQVELCITAAQLLEGDSSGIRYPTTAENAIKRCREACAGMLKE